jgi:hypothetical protein
LCILDNIFQADDHREYDPVGRGKHDIPGSKPNDQLYMLNITIVPTHSFEVRFSINLSLSYRLIAYTVLFALCMVTP